MRFRHQNTKLYAAVSALQPENSDFLNIKMLQPLLNLVDRTSVEAEFDVARTYVAKFNGDEKTKPTTAKLFSEYCEALKTMPTVHLAIKLGITFGANTASVKILFCSENYRARSQAINNAR